MKYLYLLITAFLLVYILQFSFIYFIVTSSIIAIVYCIFFILKKSQRYEILFIISLIMALFVFIHPGKDSLIEDGEKLIRLISEHKETRGVYPNDLKDIAFNSRLTLYGRWKYSTYDQGKYFELQMGNVGLHFRILFYDSKSDNWSIGP